jgi:hypothetical protein
MISKQLLIKSLDMAGHRESALQLQNWGVMDDIAKSMSNVLSKGRSAETRQLTGGQSTENTAPATVPPVVNPKLGGHNNRPQGGDPKNEYGTQAAGEHPAGSKQIDRGGSAKYRLRVSGKGSTRKWKPGQPTESMTGINVGDNEPHIPNPEWAD